MILIFRFKAKQFQHRLKNVLVSSLRWTKVVSLLLLWRFILLN